MTSLRVVAFAALFLLLFVDLEATPRRDLVSDAEWAAYKRKYNKYYAERDDDYHKWLYSNIVKAVRKNNLEYAQGNVTFLMKTNEFSDTNRGAVYADTPPIPAESIKEPELKPHYKSYHEIQNLTVDWRELGFVSPVRHQGSCNSCWAFSSTGVLEAHLAKKTGKRTTLSTKHLLDCVSNNMGCYGGWVSHALNYTKDNGISPWESYAPYQPKNETCGYNHTSSHGSPRGYVTIEHDEKKMAEVVYNIGPMTVSINHLYPEFYEYHSGVLRIPECRNEKFYLKHSMLLVGFGTDPIGGDYWLIKNSFGENWGENGFLKLARNEGNMCGVASLAQYPIM